MNPCSYFGADVSTGCSPAVTLSVVTANRGHRPGRCSPGGAQPQPVIWSRIQAYSKAVSRQLW